MFKVNQDYLKLPGSYLFSTVARKQREYQAAHPDGALLPRARAGRLGHPASCTAYAWRLPLLSGPKPLLYTIFRAHNNPC